jgi:hypothetical protein
MLAELSVSAPDGHSDPLANGDEARWHLGALPLGVVAGQVLGVHDIRALAWAAADPPQLIVVDTIALLPDGDVAALKHLAVDLHCALLAAVTVAQDSTSETFIPEQALLDVADVVAWAPRGVIATVFANST